MSSVVNKDDIEKIIIESTGVANSVEILKQLMLSGDYGLNYEFGANIMLVDALEDDVDEVINSKKQEMYLSDLILITKSDLVDKKELKKAVNVIGKMTENIEISLKGKFNFDKYFNDEFKSKVQEKVRNNIDSVFMSNKDNVLTDNYHVLKINSAISDEKVDTIIKLLLEDSEMKIKRVKGFYKNSNNRPVIVNGTRKKIQYLQGNTNYQDNVIVFIGSGISSSKIEKVVKLVIK